MLKLRRLFFDSIGDTSARFSQVTLDFTSEDGQALDSIIWLRNGGGKTSLLALYFSLFLPHRRDFLGSKIDGRALADYVATGDTSHVVAEWETSFGPLVTGAVYEWPDARRPAEYAKRQGDLRSRWYAFSPDDQHLTFDSLPFRSGADGPRHNLDGFVGELRAMSKAHHRLGLTVATSPPEWAQALANHDIDPAVFRYQKEMNRGEGSIDELFRFSTSEAFVDFLVDLAVDSEAPDSLSRRLDIVTDKLASRPLLETELEYCDGVAARMGPLAQAWTARQVAYETLVERAREAHQLTGQFDAAATGATDVATTARASAEEHDVRRRAAETARTAAGARAAIYGRIAAELRVTEAAELLDQVQARLTASQTEIAAWALLERRVECVRLDAEIEGIDAELAAKSDEVEPLRQRRNAAARSWFWRLTGRATDTADRRDRAAADEGEFDGLAATLTVDRKAATATAAAHAQDEAVVQARLDAQDASMDAAAVAGHIGPGETLDAALARLRSEDDSAAQAILDLDTEVAGKQQRLSALTTETTGLVTANASDQTQLDGANATLAAFHADESALASHERVRELAQSDDVALRATAVVLDRRLGEEIAATEAELVSVRIATATDSRNRAALEGDDGLLPPSQDVEAVQKVLDAAGVTTVTGLAFLSASVKRSAWEATIAAHPGLLSGLLVEAADVDAATAALAASGLHPGSLVTVAPKASILDMDGTKPVFVVPPSPALFDVQQARLVRKSLDAQLRASADRIALLEAGRDADRELRDRLRSHTSTYPPARIAELNQTVTRLESAIAGRTEQLVAVEAETVAVNEWLDGSRTQRTALDARKAAAVASIAVLVPLAAEFAQRDELESRAKTSRDLAEASREEADGLERDAAEATARARALRDQVAQLAEQHRGLVRELEAVDLVGDDDWGSPQDSAPSDEVLKDTFVRLHQAYADEVDDKTLTYRRDEAASRRAAARTDVNGAPSDVKGLADELERSDAASSADRRTDAAAAAVAAREGLLGQVALAQAECTEAAGDLVLAKTATSSRRLAAGEEEPATRAAALELQAQASADAEAHQAAVTAASRLLTDAVSEAERAEARADRLALLARGIRDLVEASNVAVPEIGDVSPYAGSEADAQAAQMSATGNFKDASAAHVAVEATLAARVTDLREFAQDETFAKVGAGRDVVLTSDPGLLAADASRLAEVHVTRAGVLRADLASVAEDQEIIVADLAGQVRGVLELLNKAPRTSRLPAGLGDWEGKSFLTISFDDPSRDESELRRRVSAEVDAVVARGSVPDGIATLKRALHAAVPKGFGVRVLKPTPDLREERVPVTMMGKWSGGEKVTAAVVLYCTLARLRAGNRRSTVASGSGALVLDNPLGKSSYIGFVALQRRVAGSLGVQLLYTTAVRDLKAVGAFPNVVRCRNVSPPASVRRYVAVDGRSGDAHGIPIGVISSARVTRTDEPDASTDEPASSGDPVSDDD